MTSLGDINRSQVSGGITKTISEIATVAQISNRSASGPENSGNLPLGGALSADTPEHNTVSSLQRDNGSSGFAGIDALQLELRALGNVEARAASTGSPAPVGHLGPAQQIATHIANGKNGLVEVTLQPEELGKVRISVTADGNALHLSVIADRPETLDLLRRSLPELRAEMLEMGFGTATFDFTQSGGGDDAQTGPDKSEPPVAERSEADRSGLLAPRLVSSAPGRLDLRI